MELNTAPCRLTAEMRGSCKHADLVVLFYFSRPELDMETGINHSLDRPCLYRMAVVLELSF